MSQQRPGRGARLQVSMLAARTHLAGLALAASLLAACDDPGYAVWIEYDYGSLSVSAWDAQLPNCRTWYPPPPSAVGTDADPEQLECLEPIDEVLLQLPGIPEPFHHPPEHEPSRIVWSPLEVGDTIVVTVRGRYGDLEIPLRLPEPLPELPGIVKIDAEKTSVTWSAPPATLVCVYVDLPASTAWSCGADVGWVEIPPVVDPDTIYIKRLWSQPSDPDVSLWERQEVNLRPDLG